MSSQYDSIVNAYREMRKLPIAILESHNMRQALAPYIHGAKILDLACGSGHFSRQYVSWGASSVVGVDISKGQIADAKASSPTDTFTFHVADCGKPTLYEGGPFDIVTGCWLLNYAATEEEVVDMFRNIAMNLKDGGRFVGITPHPTEDPVGQLEARKKWYSIEDPLLTAVKAESGGSIKDGVKVHVMAKGLTFNNYHLKRSVYERAAKDGGMRGKLTWKPVTMPEDRSQVIADPKKYDEVWGNYCEAPHFGIMIVEKGAI
ncbi:MAG: hypothetical protein Q9220_003759 [cf. Caloplaca sp. 1 TL-2023]